MQDESENRSEYIASRNRRFELVNEGCRLREKRLCEKCRYAVFDGTRLCTNVRCERSAAKCPQIDINDFNRRYAAPKLFHGRAWGGFEGWSLDVHRWTLGYKARSEVRGSEGRDEQRLLYLSEKELDLASLTDSTKLLDALFQVRQWASEDETMLALIDAFKDIFDPQQNLCSLDKRIDNPAEFLESRAEGRVS